MGPRRAPQHGRLDLRAPHLRERRRQETPDRLRGRPESASPATGSGESHKLEQKMLVDDAFAPPQTG